MEATGRLNHDIRLQLTTEQQRRGNNTEGEMHREKKMDTEVTCTKRKKRRLTHHIKSKLDRVCFKKLHTYKTKQNNLEQSKD